VSKGQQPSYNITEDEIKDNFRLLTNRPITPRTLYVGKRIAKTAQWRIIETLRAGLVSSRVGNYYLVDADIVDELLKELENANFEHHEKE
jgi:hypothetical protein